jgi:hypothetical protein
MVGLKMKGQEMLDLQVRTAQGGQVQQLGDHHWKLTMPEGLRGPYRWAQIDDHLHCKRSELPWQPPVRLELRARVSSPDIRGTWGFGFWNDPFSMSFRVGGAAQRLPALPNAAWFFNASPPNYLAFHNDHPAQGFLAATFRSPLIPSALLIPGAIFAPLLLLRPSARLLRWAAGLLIQESGVNVPVDVTGWHDYRLDWLDECVRFLVDGKQLYETRVTPKGRMGLVIWVDNQFAAFPPSGQLAMGTLGNQEETWMEVDQIKVITGRSSGIG